MHEPRWTWFLCTAAVLLLVAPLALAQGGYDLSWWTVDGGGHNLSTGSGYKLGGTIGQPDAGVLTGGGYELAGGFWAGGVGAGAYKAYLPLVLRGHRVDAGTG